jgi:hypothetical protein
VYISFHLFLQVFGGDSTWPIAFGFPGIPALFLCCILPFCPESPKVKIISIFYLFSSCPQYSLLTKHDRAKTLDDISRLVDVKEGQIMFEDLRKEAENNGNVSKSQIKYILDIMCIFYIDN